MRVAFYDPYLHILGGGEKVLLTILEETVRAPDTETILLSPSRADPAQWRRLRIAVGPDDVQWRPAGPLTVTPRTRGIDLFVALINHLPPRSWADRSVAVVQFPMVRLTPGEGRLGRVRRWEGKSRLRAYEKVVCYSKYVRQHIIDRLDVEPEVIYPPVDLPADGGDVAKEKKVIAVGRFFTSAEGNDKKHEILIDAWSRLEAMPEAAGWELNLVGGVQPDRTAQAHLDSLRDLAQGLRIRFHPNADASALVELYRQSALFWHATGFGETRPDRLEHFGITTVEAMAYGCVPLVPGLGGQVEIVDDGQTGHLWLEVDALVRQTAALMSDPSRAAAMRARAVEAAARFSKERFLARVREDILRPAGVGA